MTEEKFAKWRETRRAGTLNFIFRYSLWWGVTTGILFLLFSYFLSRFFSMKNTILFEPRSMVIILTAFLVGGIFVAISIWQKSELEYQKFIGSSDLKEFSFWISKQGK